MSFRVFFSFVFLTTSVSPSFAFWDVQNSGEDVFGNVNVTVSSIGDNSSLLRFECGSTDRPFFAFLILDSSGSIPEVPAKFIHQDEDGDRQEANAILRPWNDKFVAVQVYDPDMIERVANHMVNARRSISVGVSVPGTDFRKADTFSSRGSTAAGKVVLEHCYSAEEKQIN
ncbi:MAG: hypothetical protein WA921_06180 [Ahrensia sp.]